MRKKILLLGSSMTQRSFSVEHHGWGASLANWYCRTADILNRGAGGYNSSWCRMYLPKLLGGERPDMAILFVGNNDATESGERQHVPLVEYQSNILAILESLYNIKPTMAVLLVTPTRVNEELKQKHCNQRRADYAEVVRDIVRRQDKVPFLANKQLALVDLWSGGEQQAVLCEDLHDGAHLGRSGNRKVFEKLRAAVNAHWPQLSPDAVRHRGNKRRPGFEPEEQLLRALKRSSLDAVAAPTSPCSPLRKELVSSDLLAETTGLQLTVPLWHEIDQVPDKSQ